MTTWIVLKDQVMNFEKIEDVSSVWSLIIVLILLILGAVDLGMRV